MHHIRPASLLALILAACDPAEWPLPSDETSDGSTSTSGPAESSESGKGDTTAGGESTGPVGTGEGSGCGEVSGSTTADQPTCLLEEQGVCLCDGVQAPLEECLPFGCLDITTGACLCEIVWDEQGCYCGPVLVPPLYCGNHP